LLLPLLLRLPADLLLRVLLLLPLLPPPLLLQLEAVELLLRRLEAAELALLRYRILWGPPWFSSNNTVAVVAWMIVMFLLILYERVLFFSMVG
jgi:hypothetical protein